METIDQPQRELAKRPDFLTVLCVLTFLNVAYHFVSGLIAVGSSGTSPEAVEESREQVENIMAETEDLPEGFSVFFDSAMDSAAASAENALVLGLGEIVIFLVIGIGAFLMWRQQKLGFHIYLGANIVWLFFTPSIIGFNITSILAAGFVFVFVALFAGLYGANLKHMH